MPETPRSPRRRPHHPVTRTSPGLAAPGLRSIVARAELDIAPAAIDQVEGYLDRMLEANRTINLTGIRDRDDALVLHALDSLFVWNVVALEPKLIIDLGSGNGFPGVAAACLWPNARTILVERTRKKARAIERCLRASGLAHVEVVDLDASQVPARLPALRAGADLALSRAMDSLPEVTRLAAPLLATSAVTLVHWKAAAVAEPERAEGNRAARRARLSPRDDLVYLLPGREPRVRRLVCYVR